MKVRFFRKELQEKKGIALIMALWIMAILVAVASSFAFMMRTELRMARNYVKKVQSYYLALTGVEHAITKLKADTGTIDHYGEDWFTTFAINFHNSGAYWDPAPITFTGIGTYYVKLSDENSKCNINYATVTALTTLVATDNAWGGGLFRNKAYRIWDYRDGTQPIPPFGTSWGSFAAGSGSYEGPGNKNNFFDTIYEIQRVKDINEGLASMPYDNPLDHLPDPTPAIKGNTRRGSKFDMTVYSQDRNTTVTGVERVNAADCAASTLTNAGFSTAEANSIIASRPLVQWDYPMFDSVSTKMGVGGLLNCGVSVDRMKTLADVVRVADPTGDGQPFIPGAININTASPYGLLVLPGLGLTKGYDVIIHRIESGPFTSRGQIMNVSGIKHQIFEEIADLVTVRSNRFRIETEATISPAVSKIEAVIDRDGDQDGTKGDIRILYWSEKAFEF
jgi:DNA uptake protein ComE-like DNA-binding protein